ncbi:MAG: ribonuclease R [Micavibrio aeruginosavorus]|uniref:Ribonuclease R n=1 Tax=Micavibrio aeruginosavorus TaxID=349221 RepID=A0A7T5R254_9BACT|nr:MAG: ribonuclease R [Micavibrio aeruginosavorus]
MKDLPLSADAIIRFLAESPTPLTKREIARAFDIKGDGRILLKEILRELEDSGAIVRQPGQAYAVPKALPTVGIIEITDIDADGDLLARPAEWDDITQGDRPRIEVMPAGKGHADLGAGDRALARLRRISDKLYEAEIIRRLDAPQNRVLGMVVKINRGFILKPTDRKAKYEFDLPQADMNGAKPGDLCVAEVQPGRGLRNKRVRILEVVGQQNDPRTISVVAMHEVGIKPEFTGDVINETKQMTVPDLKGREDLRSVPLVTIDGADARDFDDAVFAEETPDGFHLIVAIADVAHYVTFGSALNREALRRGNSTYFPDRVVPMLPEKLSNDLCSLVPRENRATLAAHMWIDAKGHLHKYKFVRGLMRSEARLTYEQVQAARNGVTDDVTGPLMERVINPLYKAYEILWKAREERGALDLDLPERRIVINEKNEMAGVKLRERLDAHKLIEEFMILANVAAAQALEARKTPCVYRVHERPSPEKLDTVREFIEGFGLSLPKGQVLKPAQINQLLHKAAGLPYSQVISQVVLRCQAQAHYTPENAGHFGLALQRYAHFTSPIRRYADLLIHRALIRACDLGGGGLHDEEMARLEDMSQHISDTERRSMEAERAAVDRFTATWLAERTGGEFDGRITGVTRFGLFVTLEGIGADGIVPMRSLPDDFYDHDEHQHALIGRRSRRLYRLGASLRVRLKEADPLTGGMVFAVTNTDSADIPGLMMATPAAFRGKPRNEKRSWNKKKREPGRERSENGKSRPGQSRKGGNKGGKKRR